MTIGEKTKKLLNVKKMPKICSLKIHKGAGIFKKPQNLFK